MIAKRVTVSTAQARNPCSFSVHKNSKNNKLCSPAIHFTWPILEPHWDKPEVVMNKLIYVVALTGSLLLLDAPAASAHNGAHSVSPPPAYFRYEAQRAKQMPRWLHRNKSFRAWYRTSPLKRNRYLAWHHLYDAWYWEQVVGKRYRQEHHHDRDHHGYDHRRGKSGRDRGGYRH